MKKTRTKDGLKTIFLVHIWYFHGLDYNSLQRVV